MSGRWTIFFVLKRHHLRLSKILLMVMLGRISEALKIIYSASVIFCVGISSAN
jgi:hypothetical protein